MKKLIAIGAVALMLTTCGTSAQGKAISTTIHQQVSKGPVNSIGDHVSLASRRYIVSVKLQQNTRKVNKVVSQLKGRVGKTWYVFSGATPAGWDCSGMTMWAYEQLGFNLEHRASKQKDAGTKVKTPKIGDIVAFTYKGYKSAYHVGIYIGPDLMIHAGGGKGERTSIVHISKFAGEYSKVTYTRIIDTI